jgi:anti-sigma-K factor RskA
MTLPEPMTHDEALEIAGLYVLDALTPDEKAEVDAHLAACAMDHSEFETLGGVAPALASQAEPVGTPAALKRRVMEAYAAEHPRAFDVVAPARRPQTSTWLGWAAAGLAVVLLAVLGVVGLNLKNQADLANQRADQLAAAVAALAAPGSQVAILHGTGAAADVSGFAAYPSATTTGTGYMVMTGVPAAPVGETYQAWYITDGMPVSAGTMATDSNGTIVSTVQPLDGAGTVAVTVEPAGGSDQPTSDPIIVGTVTTVAAPS